MIILVWNISDIDWVFIAYKAIIYTIRWVDDGENEGYAGVEEMLNGAYMSTFE